MVFQFNIRFGESIKGLIGMIIPEKGSLVDDLDQLIIQVYNRKSILPRRIQFAL